MDKLGWNIEKRFQGQTNECMLTKEGINQAELVANKLKDYDYDIIISSPLGRTMQTAEIINKYHGKIIQKDDRLMERGYGNLEGEFAQNANYTIQELWDYNKNIGEEKVEQVQTFFKRIYQVLDDLKSENRYKKVLLVSHSGVGIAMRTYFNGIPQNKDLLSLGIKNCETIRFDIDTNKYI